MKQSIKKVIDVIKLREYCRRVEKKDLTTSFEMIRWPSGVRCPLCKSERITRVKTKRRHHCRPCNYSFGPLVGTAFHRTHVSLEKWFFAVFLLFLDGHKVSVREMAYVLSVNKNTARRMKNAIKKYINKGENLDVFARVVEVTEAILAENNTSS